jgi:monoamine oxidase
MNALCDQFRLKQKVHRYSCAFWDNGSLSGIFSSGQPPYSIRSQAALKSFMHRFKRSAQAEQEKLQKIDWWTQLRKLGLTSKELDRLDQIYSTDFGESIRHTSALVGASESAHLDASGEMDKSIVGGNDLLPNALAKAITRKGSRVRLNSEVAQVEQAKATVLVTTRAGRVFSGDACICAIPAPRLSSIRWNPRLSEDQRSAADEMQYSRIMKTAVLFPRRFWPESVKEGFSLHADTAWGYCYESTYGQRGPEGIICTYTVGDKADYLAGWKKSRLAKTISDDLSAVFSFRGARARCLHSEAWQKSKYFGGAYALYRPGQGQELLSRLRRAHRRVEFAGEHLSDPWQGYMEGAVETGEAAADRL